MPHSSDMRLLDELLGPLHMHFLAAHAAYGDYLSGGKTFLHASVLRRINLAARALLLSKGWLLPESLQQDALALVRHWDVWLTLWEDLERREQPRAEDPFVFQNDVTYPRGAQEQLELLYVRLKLASCSAS